MGSKFKCIIAGGRDFNDYSLLKQKCDIILKEKKNIEIVSGTARGADKLGEKYAKERSISIKRFSADWDNIETSEPCVIRCHKGGKYYNVLAGNNRNRKMAEYTAPDGGLIVFWDGKSGGSKDMIRLAEECKLKIKVVRY